MTAWTLWETASRTASGDTESTRIEAEPLPGGALRLSGVDSGPSVERTYGDWDYEYWATISATDQPAALAALAALALTATGPLHFSELIQLLKGWGVTPEEGCWM